MLPYTIAFIIKGENKMRYSVSVEICHILDECEARRLAEKIRHRLDDIQEDVYICVGEYDQVRAREPEDILV